MSAYGHKIIQEGGRFRAVCLMPEGAVCRTECQVCGGIDPYYSRAEDQKHCEKGHPLTPCSCMAVEWMGDGEALHWGGPDGDETELREGFFIPEFVYDEFNWSWAEAAE